MSIFFRVAAKPDIGISKQNIDKLCELLNGVLADQHVLAMKIHGFHWNVKNENFPELHKLFDDQYEHLQEAIDGTAERCVMLGGRAYGSLSEMLKNTTLPEAKGVLSHTEMIRELLDDHEACIKNLRGLIDASEKLGDMGTNDFLIGLVQDHEKMAWFLRAMQ